jgi:CRP-like cAMP-binding protein
MILIERLRNVEIFQGLKDEELQVVARFCHEETMPEGCTLCEEGARAIKLFILEEGAISIRFMKGVNFAVQTPGKILGWSFLVPPNRYTASAVTIRPSKLLVINSPDFYALVNQDPKMGLKIMNNLAQVVASRMKAFVDYY